MSGQVSYKYLRKGRFDFPIIEDWIARTSAGALGWTSTANTGGTSLVIAGENDRIGIARLSTGTTDNNTGRIALNLGTSAVLLGGRDSTYFFTARIPTLSEVGSEIFAFMGLGDNTGAGTTNTDGLYFLYDPQANPDGRFRAVASNNNVRTIIDTGVTVAANQWYEFYIKYNAALNNAEFYIDDVLVATINTNIPTASGRQVSSLFKVSKATTATTTAKFLDVDNFIMEIQR